jgi:pimeloyl-ACP methyl ester carboxylesterase
MQPPSPAPFGVKKREDWRELVEPALRRDGARWLLHYDPGLAVPFKSITPEGAAAGEAAMWTLYDHVRCPTLIVRGEQSDLLTRETLAEMAGRGPRPATAEVPGVGHAPTFMFENEIALVRDFLLR